MVSHPQAELYNSVLEDSCTELCLGLLKNMFSLDVYHFFVRVCRGEGRTWGLGLVTETLLDR